MKRKFRGFLALFGRDGRIVGPCISQTIIYLDF